MSNKPTFQELMGKRILKNKWNICITRIKILYPKFNPLDISILLICHERMLNNENNFFYSTKLMWELNMAPTHYKDMKDSLNKLYKYGLIEEKIISKRRYPCVAYWINKKGSIIISEIINNCKVVKNVKENNKTN